VLCDHHLMGLRAKLRRPGRAGWVIAVVSLCLIASGCGEEALKPAAEPAESPPLTREPAGKVVTIGMGAEGLIYHPPSGLIALGLREPYRLAFVDPESLYIRWQIPLSNPVRHLGLSPGNRKVVVPVESANKVIEAAPFRPTPPAIATGEHPHDAVSADGRVFVADEFGDSITVIEGARVVDTLETPAQPGGIAAVGDRYLALITVADRDLDVYDAVSGEELGQVSAGVGPTHIETLGRHAYVADTEGDLLRKFLVGPEPVEVAAVPAPGTPYGIAVDARRMLLWVAMTETNRLVAYSLRGEEPVPVIGFPTIRQPNTVTVDPIDGDVFVASRSDAKLQRISPPYSRLPVPRTGSDR
jgi:DNA-binding beta-propeller fold protein YncE